MPAFIHPSFIDQFVGASSTKIEASVVDPTQLLRRRVRSKADSKRVRLHLTETAMGVLDWEEAAPQGPRRLTRRISRSGVFPSASSMETILEFDRLEPSQITQLLASQDHLFTPARGIRRLDMDTGKLVPSPVSASRRFLLIIHGTFSNGDNLVRSLNKEQHSQSLLRDASSRYPGGIYTFDHPTISVGPILNALDLQESLANSTAEFDIIAHSRGGLVTRWWCETFDPGRKRCQNAVLVGSPLAGTGLASPANIRRTFKLLTNYGHVVSSISGAAMALPLVGMANTLMQVITAFTSVMSAVPIADSIMAMIPGLFAQSAVGNNPELLRLHRTNVTADRYAAIQSTFEPENPGWRFWKYFSKAHFLNAGADILFYGPNDLVVETPSMTYLNESLHIARQRSYNFGTNGIVHHVNYFESSKTSDAIRRFLAIPTS